jgi:hypothetical protein
MTYSAPGDRHRGRHHDSGDDALPDSITVLSGAGVDVIDGSYAGNGLRSEIEQVHASLGAGLTLSAVIPLDGTIALASTLDAIRARIGLVFPNEGAPISDRRVEWPGPGGKVLVDENPHDGREE